MKEKKKYKHINKVSKKRQEEIEIYTIMRRRFLEKFPICFIENCYAPATTIEHLMGRQGYADQWARDNDISLFLDIRYWAPCCLHHNLELVTNPQLNKEYSYGRTHGKRKRDIP